MKRRSLIGNLTMLTLFPALAARVVDVDYRIADGIAVYLGVLPSSPTAGGRVSQPLGVSTA
jgi:hypothetical protein